jgi:thymidylate synthase
MILSLHADAAWKRSLQEVFQLGESHSPRGLKTLEMLNHSIGPIDITRSIITSPSRGLNYHFLFGEAWWILSGSNRLEDITPFCKGMGRWSDDGVFMRGAYGPRVVDQLGYVVDTLLRDPYSRQAVMTIWRERPAESKDMPCTISLQFFIRNRGLHCVAYMRSSDLWLGVPYDIFNFSMITLAVMLLYYSRKKSNQAAIDAIGSTLSVVAGSRHLYEENWEKASAIALCADHAESRFITFIPPTYEALITNLREWAAAGIRAVSTC